MFKVIGSIIALAIVGVLIAASLRPNTFHVERSSIINATPDSLFALVDDFHRWGAWSPWEKLDPAMKREFSGAPNGKGAVYAWSGNSNAGAGRMEIVDVTQPSRIGVKLDFTKPFESHNLVTFSFVPSGGSTKVTWAMDGPSPFVSKMMGVFMSMDRMIGGDFESGLSNMKSVAEGRGG